MFRIIFKICFFLSCATYGIAQSYFSKTYLTGDSIIQIGKTIHTLENDLIISTARRCQNFTDDCGDIFSIDAMNGNLNWRKNFDWVDFNLRPIVIKKDTIVAVGYNNKDSILNWYLTKISIQGDSISNDTFNFTNSHRFNINIGIDEIKNGYIMYGFGDDLNSNEILSLVILDDQLKLDTMYDIQFHPEFNWMIDVREDFSGEMVFLSVYNIGNTLLDQRNIIKMSREGEQTSVWKTDEPQNLPVQPNSFEIHPDGSYLFYQYDFPSDNMSVSRTPYLYHIDSSGIVNWIYEFIPPLESNIIVKEISIAENGDIILVGDIWLWDSEISNFKPYRGYIARMSYEGELLWERQIFDRHESGLEKESFLFDIAEMADGSIVATGNQERIEGEPWKDLWVVKLSPDGCLNTPNCTDTLDISVYIEDLDIPKLHYSISPNPSNGIFYFSLEHYNSSIDEMEIIVYNKLGQILISENLNNTLPIDLSPYPSSIYFYSILRKGEVLQSGKLVKE